MNHNSSSMTPRRKTRFVVNNGKLPFSSEKRICGGANIDKVIVSQITASSRHPNADRLSVCEVDDGDDMKRQVVCGATNYKVGDKVPLALPGAKLPNGTEIRKSKLRGIESEGMLCSAIELGLGARPQGRAA